MKDLGAIPPRQDLPDQLILGTLHEAFDAYEAEIRKHNLKPGAPDLTPYGRLRLERVKRFRTTTRHRAKDSVILGVAPGACPQAFGTLSPS